MYIFTVYIYIYVYDVCVCACFIFLEFLCRVCFLVDVQIDSDRRNFVNLLNINAWNS